MNDTPKPTETNGWAPVPKVTAYTAAAAFATIVVALLQMAGVDIPPGVEGSLAVVLGFAAGYLTRS